jgi:ABC-2 type transport system permease protein
MAREALVPVISGAVVPLVLFPWSIGDVLGWLPFASMVSAPLRIYTGDGDVLRLLALQAAWALVLWTATRRAWVRSAARMVSFGG